MAGKRSKRRLKAADGDDVKKANNGAEVKIRQQVLPKETLLEVFNRSERVDLDQWGTVSRQYDATIQFAQPLRPVTGVQLEYDFTKKVYEARFYHKELDEPRIKQLTSANVSDVLEPFFNCLRFCSVVKNSILIEDFRIDRAFVKRLKDVSKHFVCKDEKICLDSVKLSYGVSPFDVFCAFPSHRQVSSSMMEFLRVNSRPYGDAYRLSADAFLRSLAEHDMCVVQEFETVFVPATDAGILYFAFGVHNDGKSLRRLNIRTGEVSPQFLMKLVEACRECEGSRPLDIHLHIDGHVECTDELRANGRLETNQGGQYNGFDVWQYNGCDVWKFQFEDLHGFEVAYLSVIDLPGCRKGRIHFWRHCTPTFMFI